MNVMRRMLSSAVELICGVAMVAVGVVLQVHATSKPHEDATTTIVGGLLIAFGGILLAWIASRALAEQQAAKATHEARGEIDQKLDNLSRVLGQAAGQISQSVEQYELHQISPVTGFALISQANRMIYGQVNEIAVIRGSSFDSAYLLETAAKLDDLARELSTPGTAETPKIAEVRQRIEDVRANLAVSATAVSRSYRVESVDCPYCNNPSDVNLGSIPGDTASAVCPTCRETFNAHRAPSGHAFTRKRGPAAGITDRMAPSRSRWSFNCPNCNKSMSAPENGKGERLMTCTACFAALFVDADAQHVRQDGYFRRVTTTAFTRAGSRPKVNCPTCTHSINAGLIRDDGYFGICPTDRVAIFVAAEAFREYLADVRPELNGAMQAVPDPSTRA